MNALAARMPPKHYPKDITHAELLAEWEVRLSRRLVEHKGGCIEWTGPLDGDTATCHAPGRIALWLRRPSTTMTVAQALWLCRHGRLPLHKLVPTCRSPWCVAPEHRTRWTPERQRQQRTEATRRHRDRVRAWRELAP